MPGAVVVNPDSGACETPMGDVAAAFPGSRIHEVVGKEVKPRVREAVQAEPEFVAVAGGDGTLRCAAGILAGTEVALLPVPAGTRNHFAREVGIVTLDDAARAASGRRRRIDVGEVNGEVFINNAGIGVYPRIVRRRKADEKRMPRALATLAAVWADLRSFQKFNITVDGCPYRAWMVFVGNGRYGRSLFDVGERGSLDSGVLDVRILLADQPLARLRTVGALLTGQVHRSPMAVFDEVSAIELHFERPEVDVALDGEIVRLRSPLVFRCRRGALTVLVPDDDGEAAPSKG
ncbi:MAG: NAD(+)/NADH kinase [Actinobacteria bacterium]|nr:NAD(+)/NADH kinase [Actinomycetota bacterium]